MGGDASVESRTLKVKIRDACSLVSPVMLFYVLAQFTCWTVHDAIQEWMFKQVGSTSKNLRSCSTCQHSIGLNKPCSYVCGCLSQRRTASCSALSWPLAFRRVTPADPGQDCACDSGHTLTHWCTCDAVRLRRRLGP